MTGDPWDQQLQLPRRALEEEGIECAAWPQLHPATAMCETHIRLADARRQERRRSRAADGEESEGELEGSGGEAEADPAEAEAPLDFARSNRNTAKSSYLAKVLSPVLGYGADYELFQFVYDLWLWSSLGAKKNAVQAPLRLAMAGYAFSPEYRHAALIDVVKQLGLPTLFITVAPYEWSFPAHAWVEDEACKLLRAKLRLPVAESLHLAHVLAELAQGLLTGARSVGKGQAWKSHIFSAKDGSGGRTVLNFFGRLEYQDGKRKRYVNEQEAATQFYHGRGTAHLHMLVWLRHVEAVKLEEAVSASTPEDNPGLASLVEGSQRSWTGSGWPRRDEPSQYDAAAGLLRLHHSAQDFCKRNKKGVPEGIRAYLPEVLASLWCHTDVQLSDGRGMLLKYCSGYAEIFRQLYDGLAQRRLQRLRGGQARPDRLPPARARDDLAAGHAMVLAGLRGQHPAALPGPSALEGRLPGARPAVHEQRVARGRDASHRVPPKDKRPREDPQETRAPPQGRGGRGPQHNPRPCGLGQQRAVPGRGRHSRDVSVALYNDKYYGQWALLNVPFRSMDELGLRESPGPPLPPGDGLPAAAGPLDQRSQHLCGAGARKGHKAPLRGRAGYVTNEIPTLDDVTHILAETPETTFLTVSRGASARLNGLATQALFGDSAPLAVVPADPESNVDNYVRGKLVAETPLETPLFAGARVVLTKNLNKTVGFVNGMGATVLGMDNDNVMVRTDQGARLAIHPWTSENHVVHYPLRLVNQKFRSQSHPPRPATKGQLPHQRKSTNRTQRKQSGERARAQSDQRSR